MNLCIDSRENPGYIQEQFKDVTFLKKLLEKSGRYFGSSPGRNTEGIARIIMLRNVEELSKESRKDIQGA